MSDYVTKDQIKTINRQQTDEIINVIQSFAQQMDTRFNTIEKLLAETLNISYKTGIPLENL